MQDASPRMLHLGMDAVLKADSLGKVPNNSTIPNCARLKESSHQRRWQENPSLNTRGHGRWFEGPGMEPGPTRDHRKPNSSSQKRFPDAPDACKQNSSKNRSKCFCWGKSPLLLSQT